MLYVKLLNNQPEKFPYFLGEFRKENPTISFPKEIPEQILAEYGIYRVQETPTPDFDNRTHRIKQSVDWFGSEWRQVWIVQELPLNQATDNIRAHRDHLLGSSDWIVVKSYERGEPVPEAWIDYRQALRDVPSQSGFPYAVEWPIEPNK